MTDTMRDGRLRLSVADDGAGPPDGLEPGAGGGGLRLRLVAGTAGRLGAALDIGRRGGGTHVTLTLPA